MLRGHFRDFSRPAGAADSLGLLKNVRALQSPRDGVERKGGGGVWSPVTGAGLVESLLQG